LGLDSHHAHVQPSGAYHYHGLPVGLIERLRKEKGDDVMLLVGYAADGFPIYAETGYEKANDPTSPVKKLRSSYKMKSGKRPTGDSGPGGDCDGTFVQDYEFVEGSGDLDECNGREGVTPEYPDATTMCSPTHSHSFRATSAQRRTTRSKSALSAATVRHTVLVRRIEAAKSRKPSRLTYSAEKTPKFGISWTPPFFVLESRRYPQTGEVRNDHFAVGRSRFSFRHFDWLEVGRRRADRHATRLQGVDEV
jgi:hypothetical protein